MRTTTLSTGATHGWIVHPSPLDGKWLYRVWDTNGAQMGHSDTEAEALERATALYERRLNEGGCNGLG